MRFLLVGLLSLIGCGRIAFDLGADDGSASTQDPATLACNTTHTLADGAPLGVALVATPTGAITAWSDGTTNLTGRRLAFDGDTIAASDALATSLTRPVQQFGLVSDGADRLLLSAQIGTDALFAPLDAALQPAGGPTLRPAVSITPRAVAAPDATGLFVAAWLEAGQVTVTQLDASGAATGTAYARVAQHAPQVRYTAQRDMLVWPAGSNAGCAVDGFDDNFGALLAAPRIYAPALACERTALTRHPAGLRIPEGTNLLIWLDGQQLMGQLGTDSDVVGAARSLAVTADAADIAVAPSGFFVASSAAASLQVTSVRIDTTTQPTLVTISHLAGSPFELIEHGDEALLLSVAADHTVQLTRICEP